MKLKDMYICPDCDEVTSINFVCPDCGSTPVPLTQFLKPLQPMLVVASCIPAPKVTLKDNRLPSADCEKCAKRLECLDGGPGLGGCPKGLRAA